MLPENTGKIRRRREAALEGNFRDAAVSSGQQSKALFDSVIEKIVKQRFSHMFLKESAAFTRTDIYLRRNIFQRDFFLIMFMDIGQNLLQTRYIADI